MEPKPHQSDPPPPYSSEAGESTALLPPPTYRDTQTTDAEQPRPHSQETRADKRKRTRKVTLLLNLLTWLSIALLLATLIKHLFYAIPPVPVEEERVRIAVVGAGPAGIAAAYTLANAVTGKRRDRQVEIVLFEQKERVGGRMVVAAAFQGGVGRRVRVEDVAGGGLGASVVRERSKALGAEWKQGERQKERKKEVGFFDGRGFASKMTRPVGEIGWGMWARLVLRYGVSFLRAKELPKGTMKSFERLLSGEGIFESVSEMVEASGIGGAVGMGAVERLKINGIGGRYVDEVLAPQVWRQTGQIVGELSDLAMSNALDMENQVLSGADGGFEQLMKKFVERSGSELRLGTKVTGLKREVLTGGKYGWILALTGSGNQEKTYEMFDKVILAGPWNTSSFLSDENRKEDEVYYRSLWVVFLLSSGQLNGEYFGSSGNMPSQVLPIPSANLPSELQGIHEISHVADIFGPDLSTQSVRKLYRVLSDRSVSNDSISAFIEGGELESYEEKIENAYPLMWPRKGDLGSFKVQEGLWHTGIIEGIGSLVDLSWVAGENVGRLVAREVVKRR